MKNESSWKPTKFELVGSKLRGSGDPQHLAPSSRLHGDLLADALQQILLRHCRGRTLDLGCGMVPLYEVCRPLTEELVCADWPSSFHDQRHVDVACDLTKPLPWIGGSFDTVILTDVLEHIPTPAKLLGEIARILVPEGKLVGSVPFLYRLHEEPYDYFRYTQHALSFLAAKSGLTLEEVHPYGCGTDAVCDLIAKLVVGWHWRTGPWMANVVQRVGRLIRRRRGHSFDGDVHADMPLGYVFAFKKKSKTQRNMP